MIHRVVVALLAVFSFIAVAEAQVRVVPVQPSPRPAPPATSVDPQPIVLPADLLLRSLRLSCVGTDLASLRIVTSKETYLANWSCFPYTCATDTKTCRTGCTSNTDCAAGTICQDGRCAIPAPPRCSEDFLTSIGPYGTDSCAPYKCNASSGLCQRDCRTSKDCDPMSRCDAELRICKQ